MKKYILNEKLVTYEKGTIFELVDDLLICGDVKLSSDLIGTKYFSEYIVPNIELNIIPDIEEDDDNIEFNWKMEVKFKTTKKKMYDIQRFIYDNIEKMV